ncbi:DUF3558 family protein [Nocardia anaemiae]|uniref:DUF3558 family protein n=1 Tax=Nocardia anaemiae TaxID=263910 RepID=UPI00147112ED|nr:DUF3558 family protein [Nocardia anaemiae]
MSDLPKWDPCSDFSDAALTEAGLDPAHKTRAQPPKQTCTLFSADPAFSINIEYKAGDGAAAWKKSKTRDLESITIGDHLGDLDHRTGTPGLFDCLMRLDVRGGYVEFEFIDSFGGLKDLCGDLTRVVTVLEKHIPPAK